MMEYCYSLPRFFCCFLGGVIVCAESDAPGAKKPQNDPVLEFCRPTFKSVSEKVEGMNLFGNYDRDETVWW